LYRERAGVKDEKARKAAIDGKYSPWPVVDYRFQGSIFFEEVRHLHALEVDPRSDHINDHVTGVDIAAVFGNVKKILDNKPNGFRGVYEGIAESLLANLRYWAGYE
jgi:hypothetical protein